MEKMNYQRWEPTSSISLVRAGFPSSESRRMAGRKRSDDGYALGATLSAGVAAKLSALLKKKGIKQNELSARTGNRIPPSHLSGLLAGDGTRNFQRWQILEIAKALGVKETDLFPSGIPAELAIAPTAPAKFSFSSLHEAVEEWAAAAGVPEMINDDEFAKGLLALFNGYRRRRAGGREE